MYEELLILARESIKCFFSNKEPKISDDLKKKYSKKQACFVTITRNKQLRGCIGTLIPYQELYKDVINNSIHAAFNDSRFLPMTEKEIDKVKIEISILTDLKALLYDDEIDLLEKLDKEMGLILTNGNNSATFLPQVWEEIPNKEVFLEELAVKAGLFPEDWKDSSYSYYRVIKVKEK